MNFELFLAKRMGNDNRPGEKQSGTGPIINIAIGGIVIGVAVMLLSIAILTGFQKEIRQKVIGFGGHIQLNHFQSTDGYEQDPVSIDQPFLEEILTIPNVHSISPYANKAGILKQEEVLQGIVLKGIDATFDKRFFSENIVDGAFPEFGEKRSDSVLISKRIAETMQLQTGDKFYVFFVQDGKPKPRRFFVSGLYNTGLADFDDLFIVGDLRHVQRVNGWDENAVGGFEINVKDINQLHEVDRAVYDIIPYAFKTQTIEERFPDIFGWLELQDINVIIIVALVILVSSINMTSALLILILDRTPMIGILKALGSDNVSIRKIFLFKAAYLVSIGMFWGNALGLGLGYLQQQFRFITLQEESYYLTHVPVNFEWSYILILNLGTIVLCTLMLVLPTYVITKISAVKAIRFN